MNVTLLLNIYENYIYMYFIAFTCLSKWCWGVYKELMSLLGGEEGLLITLHYWL